MVKTVATKLDGVELRFPNLSGDSTKDSRASYDFMPFADLNTGSNPGKLISAKVVMHLPKEQELPMCFLLVDYQYNFAVGSFYRTNHQLADHIPVGSQIFIKNPAYIFTSVDLKGRAYNYKTIKCHTMADVLINGQPLVENMSQEEIVS